MRDLTPEQLEVLGFLDSAEYQARRLIEATESEAVFAAARAEAERLRAIQQAQYEAAVKRQEEEIRPLKEALRAAGIKLSVSSYEGGVWGSYLIGDGPEVEFDQDSIEVE